MRTILTTLAACAFFSAPAYSQTPTLPVCLVDVAGISPGDLRKASAIAKTIFQRAGIETEWSVCSAGSNSDGVDIRLLGANMIDPGFPRHVLGMANRQQRAVYVFYDRIRRSPLGALGNEHALLASVMAHEAGHLLGLEHARTGLMRANLVSRDVERARIGGLNFTVDEARLLRARIAAKAEAKRAD